MTSSGQRFRRRALRRGYKVDEVDAFLDRVEATLSGEPIGAPVTAQEVHDVVFRVRFGGYDEWQVDLHLDRVERQLAELEERSGGFLRPDARGREDRFAALRDEPLEQRRPATPPPPMPTRPVTPVPVGQMSGPPVMGSPLPPPPPLAPPPMMPPPMSPPMARPMSAPPLPPLPPRPVSVPPMGPPPSYPRFDDTGSHTMGGLGSDFGGRRARMDATHEMRLDFNGSGSGSGTGSGSSTPTSGAPVSMSDVQRIDAMRRTFTARRFGSGYDTTQVNRLFDAIIASLSGQSGIPVTEQELDPNQFSLVPGGYFEAEVNQALREVRELIRAN